MILSMLLTIKLSWGFLLQYFFCLLFLIRIHFKYNKILINKYFKFFWIPNIIIIIHAVISIVIYHQSFYIMRSLNNFILITVYILIAYALFVLHEKNAIKVLYNSILVYYIYCFFLAIFNVGLFTFIKNIFIPGSTVLTKWLEQHDVGLSIGLLILYAMFYQKKEKGKKREIVISLIIFILCWKKIAIGAFILTTIFIIIFNKNIDKRNRLILFWGSAGVVICFCIVYLIRDNSLINWMWAHGMNLMGRDNLYRYMSSYYEFSPAFFGRGSGFTAKLLTSGIEIIPNTINTIAALHSDILRVFIEYGFFGSLLWYCYYLILLPNHFKKSDPKIREVLFVCAIYSFVTYILDNTSNYLVFQLLYMLLPLCSTNYMETLTKKKAIHYH